MIKTFFMLSILSFATLCHSQTTLSSTGGLDPSNGTVLSSNHGFVNDDYNQWLKAKQDAQVRATANLGGTSLQVAPQNNQVDEQMVEAAKYGAIQTRVMQSIDSQNSSINTNSNTTTNGYHSNATNILKNKKSIGNVGIKTIGQ